MAAPTITGIAPRYGPVAGGNTVVITGTGFTGATEVKDAAFNLQWSFTVDSDEQITAVVAAGAPVASPSTARVVTPDGQADQTYYYTDETDPPVITSVTPNHAPHAGGTSVSIDGTGLAAIVAVRFGAVPVLYAGNPPTHLTAISPFAQGETADIVVETPLGYSNPVPFTFDYAAPGVPIDGDVVNEVTNPSFEHDAVGSHPVGWSGTGGGDAPVVVDSWAADGGHAIAAAGLFGAGSLENGYAGVYPGVALPLADGPYCARFTVKQAADTQCALILYFLDGDHAIIARPATPAVMGDGECSVEAAVAPAGSAYALFLAISGDEGALLDRVQLHRGEVLFPYADGDTPGYHWEGAPGASRTIAGDGGGDEPASKSGAALRVGDTVLGQIAVGVQTVQPGRMVKFADHSRIVRRSERVDP